MKFYYISDLHLPFYINLRSEKVSKYIKSNFIASDAKTSNIIVAGDVSEYSNQIKTTLDTLAHYYESVFFVFGNHDLYLVSKTQKELYKGSSTSKIAEIKDYFKFFPNVYILNNEQVNYKGKTIAGSRLWYSIPDSDLSSYKANIADSEYLFENENGSPWSIYSKEDKAFYDSLSAVDLMITHIPPIHPRASLHRYNSAFTALVSELKSTKWVCGHQHLNTIEEVAGTTFYMNPKGYPNELTERDFKLEYFYL